MLGALEYSTLQGLWWLLISVVGALFLCLNFVQGGQSLLWTVPRTDEERALFVNSLGLKWELTFTTLVTFGGALFAAFPRFYATSFGGAYWLWTLILFTFILQAVSYEFRTKPRNLLGRRTYEAFMLINGTLGVLLLGTAVGTFFTGADFTLDAYSVVTWTSPLRGIEAIVRPFNLALGLFLVFHARTLGAMYLLNNIETDGTGGLGGRLRRAAGVNFLISLPLLVAVLAGLLLMKGYRVMDSGAVVPEPHKFLDNLLANPFLLVLLAAGLALVIWGVAKTARGGSVRGIWFAGGGTFLVGLALLLLPAFNHTPFYPSRADPASSLTIFNASSSRFTLTVMTYVALFIPLILAYIAYVWRAMATRRVGLEDVRNEEAY